jgi:ribonuclease D
MTPITDNAALVAFCQKLKSAPFIAVDTEFMRETTYWPMLCLIQAAGPEDAACIDPLAPGLDLAPFLALLGDPNIIKVFHAARQDVEIFHNLGQVPSPLFDTQIAGMAAGFGEHIAYDSLVRQMLKIDVDKSSRFTDWSRRPLSDNQLVYALGDVTHLAKLYPKLRDRLEREGRLAWVAEEMQTLANPATYDVDPEKAWRRLKPRKFTPKYLAVFKIATQAPIDADGLNRLRSVPKGFAGSKFGPDLLEAIRTALKDPEAYAPLIERGPPPAQGQGAIVELLKVLLKARSEDAGVASKLIATVSDLEKIAADDKADAQALTGWRRDVFGADALRLKHGELALVLDGYRVKVVDAPA